MSIIRDVAGEFSGSCKPPKPGVKELHRIHRKLPAQILHNDDPDVLQDEAGLPILDEQTAQFIYDDLRAGAGTEETPGFKRFIPPEIFVLPEDSPIFEKCKQTC